MTDARPDYAAEVRNGLTDPLGLCQKLGLLEGSKRQAGGLSIRCPFHPDHDPSCSVIVGPDGTVQVKCHGCGQGGDGLTLVARIHNLQTTGSDFREVLALGAEYGGQLALAEEIRGKDGPRAPRQPLPTPEREPERDYPDQNAVAGLWGAAIGVLEDADAWECLRSRGLDPELVAQLDLARAVPHGVELPRWARYQGRSWLETDHRMLVAMFDHAGAMRSVRAWRVVDGDGPKRLPPGGCRATGLVMANWLARMMLGGFASPLVLVVVEGEPDFVSWATRSEHAVVGLISGSWNEDFARRVPRGTEVILRTHADDAGDRYAEGVIKTLGHRCPVRRMVAA